MFITTARRQIQK